MYVRWLLATSPRERLEVPLQGLWTGCATQTTGAMLCDVETVLFSQRSHWVVWDGLPFRGSNSPNDLPSLLC